MRPITTTAAWDACEANWRSIVAQSERATVFQTFEWQRTWWKHFGQGKRLHILQVGEVGFFPLMRSAGVWRFIGTGGTDYLDALALPGHEEAVCAALPRTGWLDLHEVRPGSVVESLPGAARWEGEVCPYLPLPTDGESFRKRLSKSLRSNIGYYERQMAKAFALDMRIATAETLEADMDALFRLHQGRWNARWMPGVFASARAKRFHRELAERLLAAGMLRLHILTLNNEQKAAIYCFQKGERCYYYAGGFDVSLGKYSPGTVLTARAIQHAIEADGAQEFDFLRGDEGYKYRWGAINRRNTRLSLARDAYGRTLERLGKVTFAAEKTLKHQMHAYFDRKSSK